LRLIRIAWPASIARPGRWHRGVPTVLFKGNCYNDVGTQRDVTPDGNRFLMLTPVGANGAPAGDQARPQIVFGQNWFEELKRLVPVK